ncbi:MAG: DNA polymerase III subunit alpha [Candidatus Izemoplasmatales bacterium]
MIDFNLYLQSSYSFNGSLIDIDKAVEKAASLGYRTLGLADINHMYGIIKFYKACLKHHIKPILGLEISIKGNTFQNQPIILYIKNNQGYKNLIKISSMININNQPIDSDYLKDLNEGLIAVIISDKNDIANALSSEQDDLAKQIVNEISDTFENMYIGLDLTEYYTEVKIAPKVEGLGKAVIIDKTLYLDSEDKEASIILRKILQKDFNDLGFFADEDALNSLKSLDQIDESYKNYPSAIKNSLELINLCNVSIEFSHLHLPKYPLKTISAKNKLAELTEKGLTRRLKQKNLYPEKYSEYKARLNHELEIIGKMQYEDYFLIVWDFVLYAKKSGILVGPGRGSAAGSLVAYCLGIVDVDPIEFELYFERFLNPERVTMPDIDMDFPDNKRDEVIRYVVEKYGRDRVASIVTFGTYQGKSAIRDVARIMQIDGVIVDDITSKISETDNSIEEYQNRNPKKYQYYINNPVIKKLLEISRKLNGLCRHTSTHAAGIIITEDNIHQYSPTQEGLLGMLQTQYEASDLESMGLLKIDFLGIRNLTIIADTINLIKKHENKHIDIYRIPVDDKSTFKLLQDVKSVGIFQLESEGMMKLMKDMQISNFTDIATCISLHRPGPMENIPTFIKRRNKEERINYIDPDLIPILKSTNGIIVYQEQIMKIANKFAGYSLGEADVLRRAVSKKIKGALERERTKFVQGVVKNGYRESVGNEIYDYIVKFANYGFNKSHAVAYSYVAYWMAYLKANYPNYFLAVLLNSQIGSVSGTKKYIMECQKLNVKILPPRINKSADIYRFEGNDLRFPYKAIKGIGEATAKTISFIQDEAPIKDFVDFIKRGKDLGVNIIEALIFANAFADFNINKKTLINNISNIQSYLSFDNKNEFKYVEYPEFDYEFLQKREKELLGINFEYHPIYKYRDFIKNNNLNLLSEVLEIKNRLVSFVAVVSKVKKHTTKNNREMAFLLLEDEFNSIDSVLFPDLYERSKIIINEVYFIRGKLEDERNSFIIKEIRKIKE